MHRIAGATALLIAALTAVSAQEQKPTFSVAVTLVTTDVIVRDDKGQFVADLKKDDFELLEDGQPQDLVSFVLVHGGRTFNVFAPPAPAAQEGIVLPKSRPAGDEASRVL